MKRLDQIIKEHVDRNILEQATEDWKKYTKLKPTAANKDVYTKNTIKFEDTVFQPWPTNVSPTPWPNQNMEKFLKGRLKAIAVMPAWGIETELESKRVKPVYMWKFGAAGREEQFIFYYNGLVETTKSDIDLYWAYDSEPFRTTDLETITSVGVASTYKIKVNVWSAPDTGHIVLRTKSGPYKNPYLDNPQATERAKNAHSYIYINSQGRYNIQYAVDMQKRADVQRSADLKAGTRNLLDIFGMVPVLGDVLDLGQAAWYFYDYKKSGSKWDLLMGGLSLVSAIPGAANFAGLGFKMLAKRAKLAKVLAKGQNATLADVWKNLLDDDAINVSTKKKYCQLMIWLADNFGSISRSMADIAEKQGFESISDVLTQMERQCADAEQTSSYYLKNLKTRAAELLNDIPKKGKKEIPWYRADKRIGTFAYNYSKTGDARTFVDGLVKYVPTDTLRKLTAKGARGLAEILMPLQFGTARRTALIGNLKTMFKKAVLNDREKFVLMAFHSYTKKGPELAEVLSRASFNTANLNRIPTGMLDQFKRKVKVILVPVYSTTKAKTIIQGKKKIFVPAEQVMEYQPRATADMLESEINDLLDKGAKYTIEKGSMIQDLLAYVNNKTLADYQDKCSAALDEMIADDNPLWKEVVLDPLAAAKAYFPSSLKEFGNMLWGNIKSARKQLNDAAELIHEFLEDTGSVDADENESSTVYWCIRKLINKIPVDTGNSYVKELFAGFHRRNLQGLKEIQAVTGMQDRTAKPITPFSGLSPDSTAYTPPSRTYTPPAISDRPFTPVPIRRGAPATRR